MFGVAPPAVATASYDNSTIATKALTYVGQKGGNACTDAAKPGDSGGQCRAFVNCIVWMVSGHAQNLGGSDYFQTFLNAGGTRITDQAALVEGDIVQVGQGSHTFIIVGPVGGNTFDVVDSNSDGTSETVAHYHRTFTLDANTRAYRMGTVVSRRADIIATEPSGSGVKYMIGVSNGNGTFNWGGTNLTLNTTAQAMSVADVMSPSGTPDGKADIVATEPTAPGVVKYMVGMSNGNGTFNWGGTNLTGNTPPQAMTLGDATGDGRADIIATEPNGSGVKYMIGVSNGNGTFNWGGTNLTLNTTPQKLALGDVTGDGRADIVATEPNGSGVKYMIGVSNGNGTFNWGGTNLTLNTTPQAMSVADVMSPSGTPDGKADIVATEPTAPGVVKYMVGMSNGNGTFNWGGTNLTGNTPPQAMTLGDAVT